MRIALVIVTCLLAAACASAPAPRPLASGFGAGAGVADPYADGKRHLETGQYELAIQRFGQALANDRRSLDALNGLAIAYTRLGRFDSAQSQFERALQIDPTDAATLNNYGWSLIEQGRLREARAFLEQAHRHATEAEAPVIAANVENLGRARRPALLAALEEEEEDSGRQAPRGPQRLIRVDANAYRLETTGEPVEPPAPPGTRDEPLAHIVLRHDAAAITPSEARAARRGPTPPVAAQDVSAAGAAQAEAEHVQEAEPEGDVPRKPAPGSGPIQLWPQPLSEPEADPIPAGDGK